MHVTSFSVLVIVWYVHNTIEPVVADRSISNLYKY